MPLPRPPAAALKAIADRGAAKTGKPPSQAAVLATYNRWSKPQAGPKPPTALDKTAIAARGPRNQNRYGGVGFDDQGRPLTDQELIAAVRAAAGG